MGCNQSKEKQEHSSQEDLEQKYRRSEKDRTARTEECEKLRKELEQYRAKENKMKAMKENAAKSTENSTFTAVVTASQFGDLSKIDGVAMINVEGVGSPLYEEQENVVMIGVSDPALMKDVMKVLLSKSSLEKQPRHLSLEPPKIVGKDENLDASQDKSVKEQVEDELEKKKKEDQEKEPEPDPLTVPKQTVKATTDVKFSTAWDGRIPVKFTWLFESSPFHEYDNPSGSNWWPHTNVRKAPYVQPKSVILEVRQGMKGKWEQHPAEILEDRAEVTYLIDPPSSDSEEDDKKKEKSKKKAQVRLGIDYRGFQSRWVIDGVNYLSPLQDAPTLQSKLMTYPQVRSAVQALPKDKQRIENIPNARLKEACLMIENIIPMNTWDFNYGVTIAAGAVLKGEESLTTPEKIEKIAKEKLNDPAIVSELRRTALKSPIMAVNAAAGQVGIKLDMIIKNMDFFLPKMADPDLEKLAQCERSMDEDWEAIRRDMQIDVNELYPAYQHGVRVTFPSTRVLKNAMICKRPQAEAIEFPVDFRWELKSEDDIFEQHKVQCVIWPSDDDDTNNSPSKQEEVVIEMESEAMEEKFGITREEKTTYRKYKGQGMFKKGVYKYYWKFNGEPFFNNGCPFGAAYTPADSHHLFTVDGHIQFGIGVKM